jgi:hypothetical protein
MAFVRLRMLWIWARGECLEILGMMRLGYLSVKQFQRMRPGIFFRWRTISSMSMTGVVWRLRRRIGAGVLAVAAAYV